MVNKWLKNILLHALPVHCRLCGLPSANRLMVCGNCLVELPRYTQTCPQCAEPVSRNDTLCGQCLQQPPAFDRVVSQFAYAPPIDRWVSAMKFNQKWYFARLFGELLGEHLAGLEHTLPEAVVPVPLHPLRLRQRGYNQSLEIARHVARVLKLPLLEDVCTRPRATVAQTGLSAKARRINLRDAFQVHKPVDYDHLAVLDDVVTTGSTGNALAKELKRSGVKQVDVWCVARASHVR